MTKTKVTDIFAGKALCGLSPRATLSLALALLVGFCAAQRASAQDQGARTEGAGPRADSPARRASPRGRLDLFRRLGLTPEQARQLREIRRRSEPEARALALRLTEARRALDEEIYSDALDETAVERRAREVADAQAALVRHRALTEVRVRQVLTLEQLQAFRDLRQRAMFEQRRRRQPRRGEGP